MRRSKQRRPLPHLLPEGVEDDEKLMLAIDEVLRTAPTMRAHARRIRKRQVALLNAFDDEHFQAVLGLDDAHVDRAGDMTVLLVRWAFNEGLRCGRRSAGPRGREP